MKRLQKNTAIGMAIFVATGLATSVIAADNSHDSLQGNDDHHRGKQEREINNFYDYAKVTQVQALIKKVKVSNPRRECWDEHSAKPINRHASREHNSDVIAGGIIGGIIGNQVGGSHNKDAATLAGALIGATVGHANSHQKHRPEKVEIEHQQRCKTQVDTRFENRSDGYRVTYRYRKKTFHTRMKHRPGKRIRIKIQVSLAD